ncbi:serine hydrolase [Arthrobacter sp. GMC3]|uniref:serine hydrolase n=1 Tax=Arthrobacter sp. GMC3 TaxID=2058894 RepID=UPI000CE40F07|nr:serine hydrolase [Arthrobacter sp. GMC3]
MSLVSDYSDGTPAMSYQLINLAGDVLAQRHADTTFYSASTIKLAVLVAAIQAVEQGQLSLEQQLLSTHTFTSGAPGHRPFSFEPEEYDAGLPQEGSAMSLREVLGRMITVSSNEATNMVVELVGFPAVNAALAFCGAGHSVMERLIGDIEALHAGLSHRVSARDLTRIMHAIVSGRTAGEELTELMMGWLRAQEFHVIGLEIQAADPGADWGSKSGWVTGIQHDVAFVVPRDGHPGDGYILAVCTRAYPDADATEAIRTVTAMAHVLAAS